MCVEMHAVITAKLIKGFICNVRIILQHIVYQHSFSCNIGLMNSFTKLNLDGHVVCQEFAVSSINPCII